MSQDIEPIRLDVTVAAPPSEAFAIFADELGRWWPIAYTFAGATFRDAAIEPGPGGRWYEVDDALRETSWGEVRAYDPGRRLVLAFGISPDRKPEPPERCSELEVVFTAEGEGTRLAIEHRDLARHGEGGRMLREGMASPQGWPLILAEFAREVRQRGQPD